MTEEQKKQIEEMISGNVESIIDAANKALDSAYKMNLSLHSSLIMNRSYLKALKEWIDFDGSRTLTLRPKIADKEPIVVVLDELLEKTDELLTLSTSNFNMLNDPDRPMPSMKEFDEMIDLEID